MIIKSRRNDNLPCMIFCLARVHSKRTITAVDICDTFIIMDIEFPFLLYPAEIFECFCARRLVPCEMNGTSPISSNLDVEKKVILVGK